jgi:hypothetical protein
MRNPASAERCIAGEHSELGLQSASPGQQTA